MRCAWAESSEAMQRYHDEEWGRPERDSRALWECLMLEGFQAGLSWSTILNRRDGFRRAFHEFDPPRVAAMVDEDVERLMQDAGIIRARAKILATIEGARIYERMRNEGESFAHYAWAWVDGKPIVNTTSEIPAKTELSEAISKDLKRRGFKFVGPTIVYAWMQAVGLVDDHDPNCFCRTGAA